MNKAEDTKQVEGTQAAFLSLINRPGFAKKFNYNKITASGWKGQTAKGKVTLDKMEQILTECGAKKTQEIVWQLPE